MTMPEKLLDSVLEDMVFQQVLTFLQHGLTPSQVNEQMERGANRACQLWLENFRKEEAGH
jgi:hypothetical protein